MMTLIDWCIYCFQLVSVNVSVFVVCENEFCGNENGRLSLRFQRFFCKNDRFHYWSSVQCRLVSFCILSEPNFVHRQHPNVAARKIASQPFLMQMKMKWYDQCQSTAVDFEKKGKREKVKEKINSCPQFIGLL